MFISWWYQYKLRRFSIPNEDTDFAWRYHNGSKHPDGKLFTNAKRIPYKTVQPYLFKRYQKDLKTIQFDIPEEFEDYPALQAIESDVEKQERFPYPDTLGRILHYSAGVTKTLTMGGKEIKFRAASCTGALYHIELYVICARLPGIDAGVYHYDPEQNQLQLLREGDYRKYAIEASGNEYNIEDAPVILVYTSMFWRNASKYNARSYRHAFWDSGVIVANSLAMAKMFDLSTSVVMGFVDKDVSTLLGIDPTEELPLALLPIGYSSFSEVPDPPEIEQEIIKSVSPSFQKNWPMIVEMHIESSLPNSGAVEKWRDFEISIELPPLGDTVFELDPVSTRKMSEEPLESVITRRGSTRKFSLNYITLQDFSNVLKQSVQGIPADFYDEFGNLYNQMYIIVNGVMDIPIGSYRFHPEENKLTLLENGYFREESKRLGLGQDLAHDAAVCIFFLVDLEPLLEGFGNRGYRIAQMEASIIAGRMYLAAYAQNIGATGLTFYDDMVTDFFDEKQKIVTFMICLGHKAKK